MKLRFVENYSPKTASYNNKMYFMNSLFDRCHHFVHVCRMICEFYMNAFCWPAKYEVQILNFQQILTLQFITEVFTLCAYGKHQIHICIVM